MLSDVHREGINIYKWRIAISPGGTGRFATFKLSFEVSARVLGPRDSLEQFDIVPCSRHSLFVCLTCVGKDK